MVRWYHRRRRGGGSTVPGCRWWTPGPVTTPGSAAGAPPHHDGHRAARPRLGRRRGGCGAARPADADGPPVAHRRGARRDRARRRVHHRAVGSAGQRIVPALGRAHRVAAARRAAHPAGGVRRPRRHLRRPQPVEACPLTVPAAGRVQHHDPDHGGAAPVRATGRRPGARRAAGHRGAVADRGDHRGGHRARVHHAERHGDLAGLPLEPGGDRLRIRRPGPRRRDPAGPAAGLRRAGPGAVGGVRAALAGDRPQRSHRRQDRPAERPALGEPHPRTAQRRRAAHPTGDRDDPGHRPVQAGQRHLRASRRRPGAHRAGRGAARQHARRRCGRALRRRGILHHHVRARPRPGARRRRADQGGRRRAAAPAGPLAARPRRERTGAPAGTRTNRQV